MAVLDHRLPDTLQVRSTAAGCLVAWFGRLLFACSLCVQGFGQEVEAPAAKVQAAFLYNFTKLVTWPTNAFTNSNAPIVIGVLGKDTLGEELDHLKGLKTAGRHIEVARYTSVKEINNCHVLFVSDSERRRLDLIFDALRSQPILTVGETRGFANRGMIELDRKGDNFDLHINLQAAVDARLKLSSRLIRLDKHLQPVEPTKTNTPPSTSQ